MTHTSSACTQTSQVALMLRTQHHQAEAIAILAKIVAIQIATQPIPRSTGPRILDRTFGHLKRAVEGAELLSKLWAWRRAISLTLSIAPWCAPWLEHIVGAVKWLF